MRLHLQPVFRNENCAAIEFSKWLPTDDYDLLKDLMGYVQHRQHNPSSLRRVEPRPFSAK